MTTEELLSGESDRVEYKEMLPEESEKYIKTVVAFANSGGGYLIVGVQDKTLRVVGVPGEKLFDLQDKIADTIRNMCEPAMNFLISMKTVEGKTLLFVQVEAGSRPPYHIRSQGIMGGTYIRVAGTTRKAEEAEVMELSFQNRDRSYDMDPVLNVVITKQDIDDLCESMYRYGLSQCSEEEKRTFKKVTTAQLLSWGIISMRDGIYYPTRAFELLTGTNGPITKCAVFKGTVRQHFIDRKEYDGPLYLQLDEAYRFVQRNIRMGAKIEGLHREDVYEIPMTAVREAITNAVAHRSYANWNDMQVALYDDRLEITSPGLLVSDISVDTLASGGSFIRNRAIVRAFSYMKIMENWGTGVQRIRDVCIAAGLPRPEWKEVALSFQCIIWRKKKKTADKIANKTANKTADKTADKNKEALVLQLLRQEPCLTYEEIGEHLKLSNNQVRYIMARLKKNGRIQRQGSRKTGSWVVVEDAK